MSRRLTPDEETALFAHLDGAESAARHKSWQQLMEHLSRAIDLVPITGTDEQEVLKDETDNHISGVRDTPPRRV